jgi:hypothetical protein
MSMMSFRRGVTIAPSANVPASLVQDRATRAVVAMKSSTKFSMRQLSG